jgi:uncharacterized coiled-coil protein SlyX
MTNTTSTDNSNEASDPQTAMDTADVREYHTQLADTLSPLCSLGGNPTLLVNDKKGWYVTRDNQAQDKEHDGEEFPKERRARNFCEDYNRVAATRVERTLYGLTSYKFPETFERWKIARFDPERGDNGEYVYADRKPAPLSEDIAAVAVWGDIDLEDDLKLQRPDLDEETYDIAEEAYEAYIQAFADLYGGRDAIYMLDSVGGAYIFGAPEATLPIVRYYADDPDARARVLSELIDRSNDYLGEAQQRINAEIRGASEVIDPDWANNINRQYKLPLSLHGDHDAVVTPVDVEDVHYREPTPVDAVDDDLHQAVHEWCEEFTAVEHEKRVKNLVETLWAEEYDEQKGWASALDEWVEAERERERREEQRRQAAAERREQRLDELADEQGIEGQPITPFLQDVYDALDGIDTAEVVRHYASDEWDSGADMSNKTEFNPSWRSSKSGRSCYVNHETNRFGDPGQSGGGYAVKAMALGERILTDASQDLTGEQWGEAVDALRDAGYEVPIWTPEKGSHRRDGSTYDQMPFWAMRKAAVALGVLPEAGFALKTNDDGDEYLGFPGMETYNTTLDEIEDIGLEHGRERASATGPPGGGYGRSDVPADLSTVEPAHTVRLSDGELVEKAHDATNGEKFERLWTGDTSEYDSRSKADLALCCQLAFWTAGDPDWIDRLFRDSSLMREEWDEQAQEDGGTDGQTYGEQTIANALGQTSNYYGTERSDQDVSSPSESASTSPAASPSSTASTPDRSGASEPAPEAGSTSDSDPPAESSDVASPDDTAVTTAPGDGADHEQTVSQAETETRNRSDSETAQNPFHQRLMNTQEQVYELEARIDEQQALIEDMQEQLKAVTQRLDNQPLTTEAEGGHRSEHDTIDRDRERDGESPQTRPAVDADSNEEEPEADSPSVLSRARDLVSGNDD